MGQGAEALGEKEIKEHGTDEGGCEVLMEDQKFWHPNKFTRQFCYICKEVKGLYLSHQLVRICQAKLLSCFLRFF